MSNTITLNDIEWDLEEEYIYSFSKANTLIKLLKETDKLPLSKGTIYFSSNFWDFTSFTKLNVRNSKLRFKFNNVPDDFLEISKMFVLIEILSNKSKIQSINKSSLEVNQFLNYLYSENIFDIEVVTSNDIKKFLTIKDTEVGLGTLRNYILSLNSFFTFYSSNYKDILTPEIKDSLSLMPYNLFSAYKESRKLPAIPQNYFNKIVSLFIKIMNDESLDVNKRAFACLMIIESQTGIRSSDLASIKANSIEIEKIDDKESYFLNYYTFKREKGNNVSSKVFTFINELSYTAYVKLEELFSDYRKEICSDLLFTPPTAKSLPVKDDYILERIKFFSLDNYKELNCINNEEALKDLKGHISLDSLVIKKGRSLRRFPELKPSDILSYPTTHQFRVNVCTELYHKGVPLQYIQQYMTHLSSDMQDYYVRPKKNYQENIVYSKKILSDVVTGEVKLLGKNVVAMTDKIKEYIENGKFNVAKDLDQIIEELTKKIPIRAKLGGICIKSSMLRDCSKDSKTDEFYCAYGVCPNHFHVFYMADITYERYLTLTKTYTYNKDNGFLRQAEKEKFKLLNTIKDMLIPELDEVKNEVLSKGEEVIKERYPQLTFIIENFDTIYKEVILWTK